MTSKPSPPTVNQHRRSESMGFMRGPVKLSLKIKRKRNRRAESSSQPAANAASSLDEFVEPRLPAELEQIIFEFALENNLKDATKLFLVARRVYLWLSPIVFSVVVLMPTRTFPSKLNQAKLIRYGKHITHLAIDQLTMKYEYDPAISYYISASEILRRGLPGCTNLVDLALSGGKGLSLFPVLPTLPLTHLTIQLPLLLDQLQSYLQSIPSNNVNPHSEVELESKNDNPSSASPLLHPLPVFPGLTHLNALGGPIFTRFKADIQTSLLSAHFPGLTHMAVTDVHAFRERHGVQLILEKCDTLEVLVWWTQTDKNRVGGGMQSTMNYAPPPLEDPSGKVVRVQCGWVDVWEKAARGKGMSLWDMADAEMESRPREVVVPEE